MPAPRFSIVPSFAQFDHIVRLSRRTALLIIGLASLAGCGSLEASKTADNSSSGSVQDYAIINGQSAIRKMHNKTFTICNNGSAPEKTIRNAFETWVSAAKLIDDTVGPNLVFSAPPCSTADVTVTFPAATERSYTEVSTNPDVNIAKSDGWRLYSVLLHEFGHALWAFDDRYVDTQLGSMPLGARSVMAGSANSPTKTDLALLRGQLAKVTPGIDTKSTLPSETDSKLVALAKKSGASVSSGAEGAGGAEALVASTGLGKSKLSEEEDAESEDCTCQVVSMALH